MRADAGADGVTGLGAAIVACELQLSGGTEERGAVLDIRIGETPVA